MKKYLLISSTLFFLLSSISFAQSSNENAFVPGQVIVQANIELTLTILNEFGVTAMEKICKDKQGKSNLYVLHFNGSTDIPKKIKQLLESTYFNWAEPNGYMKACMMPNDSMFPQQYGCHNIGNFNLTFSTVDSDADMPEAWDIEQGDSSVVVAILDGGIAFGHPEFAGRVWKNYGEIPGNNIDDDANGYIDDDRGWNFAYGTNSPADDLGHGTSVTGVLGANGNNSIGLAGIDWNCKLMVCKVLDNTNVGSYTNIANAIYYAVNNGANVLNMSFAGSYSSLITVAVQYAWNNNVVMCAATGNSNSSTPEYPAGDPLVLAVGGSNAWDVRYIYSNYGAHLDVVAAGDYIYDLDYSNFNNYANYSSGTSLASPFVAGIAALLKAQRFSRTNQEIYDLFRMTAEDLVDQYTGEDTPGWDMYFGYGRVNAYKALMYDSLHLGISSLSNPANIKIYPDPSNGNFTISSSQMIHRVEVTDVLGKVILTAEISSFQTEIDLSGQPKGIYFILIDSEKGEARKKMIIE